MRRALLEPPSRPTLISVSPNRARGEAKMMSHEPTSPKPAPMAAPPTPTMTGTVQCGMACWQSRHSLPESRTPCTVLSRPGPDASRWARRSFRSTPAQNALLPSADRTTAPMVRSSLSSSKVERSSAIIFLLTALTGGRSSRTCATPSSLPIFRVSITEEHIGHLPSVKRLPHDPAMTRIPYLRREELGPEGQQLWDDIVSSRGSSILAADGGLAGPFNAFVTAPGAGQRLSS